MKKIISIMIIGLASTALFQCGQSTASENSTEIAEEMRQDKEALAENLRNLRDYIDKGLTQVSRSIDHPY